ncbi:helix-turn-helix transcriptional regulator [Streptomyces sp. P38-E01]|uniref:Helix-turn-helix transcriptional regulator n=1 Tax=Streptomyces tardus TaxID=2780544 RepID=A0A949N8H0_9ACTN|nr:helix-turn-helix transcriptional regulator [Streptomyces tardus]MBU7597918.1 helix-turn-helix transcriptional regulator [Streptomyces tardus]
MQLGIDDADETDENLRLDPLAEELRSRRQTLDWTQDRLARQLGCSESLVAHWEAGRRTPSIQFCKLLDQALSTNGLFERFRSDKPFAPHFNKAAKAEQRAIRIEEFSPVFVPGLLQTPDYAREVFRGGRLRSPKDELDKKVVRRVARGKILDSEEVESLFIVSETVLLLNVGGPQVMAHQLAHLRAMVRAGVTSVQVVPHAQGNQGAATALSA